MRANRASNIATTPLAQSSAFRATTKTLLHEFTHIKQYKAVGYIDNLFGVRYLYEYCKVRRKLSTQHLPNFTTLHCHRSSFPMSAIVQAHGSLQAGFDYNEDVLEKEAFVKQEQVNGLLQDVIGTQFFDYWKRNNWAGPFGPPTRTNYIEYPALPNQYYLPFQNGGLTLVCDPVTKVC